MPVLDLTHCLTPEMPVYPGTPAPRFDRIASLERDGFRERMLYISSHLGTHLDAPAHVLPEGPSLSEMPVERFLGSGVVIDLTGLARPDIQVADLAPRWDRLGGGADFLLLRTGWDRWWGRPEYFQDCPVLTAQAARWVTGLGLKGLGLDAISVDGLTATNLPIHKILLGGGLVVIENLMNLDRLPERFTLMALPLKILDGDGSPARVVAVWE